jgi:hypothetical protein
MSVRQGRHNWPTWRTSLVNRSASRGRLSSEQSPQRPRHREREEREPAELDELELHVIPVLFGQGRRLFEGLAPEQIELERTRILEGENGVTHVHYRLQR